MTDREGRWEGVAVLLCKECIVTVIPDFPAKSWAYIPARTGDQRGCWRCGATEVPLAPLTIGAKTTNDVTYTTAGGILLDRRLGAEYPDEGDDDE